MWGRSPPNMTPLAGFGWFDPMTRWCPVSILWLLKVRENINILCKNIRQVFSYRPDLGHVQMEEVCLQGFLPERVYFNPVLFFFFKPN